MPQKIITIIGVGLMGGSLAAALKRNLKSVEIYGVDFPAVLDKAQILKIIDRGFTPDSVEKAVKPADIIFLCTSINKIREYMPIVAELAKKGAVITDMGSTKAEIIKRAQEIEIKGSYFIGGHPMTGSELHGVENIDPLLFENSVYVLTPIDQTPPDRIRNLALILEQIGARVLFISPSLHDRIAAFVSHLPQLLAVALTNLAGEHNASSTFFLRLAAGGFRDMTRIASSPYEVWEDIINSNTDEIIWAIDAFIKKLSSIQSILQNQNLRREFELAAKNRLSIPRDTKGFMLPRFDISVSVEDKPGVLAEISSAVSEQNINIKDIEVLKVREGESGVFRLAFQSEQDRKNAVEILTSIGYKAQYRN